MAWDGTLLEGILDIPMKIIPGKKPTMRCCVFKERAIVLDEDGFRHGVQVQTGATIDGYTVIEDGLKEGDKVVIAK